MKQWSYEPSDGVDIYLFSPAKGVRYMVTRLSDNIQAHITTGTTYKFTRPIKEEHFTSVESAKEACEQHWNSKTS